MYVDQLKDTIAGLRQYNPLLQKSEQKDSVNYNLRVIKKFRLRRRMAYFIKFTSTPGLSEEDKSNLMQLAQDSLNGGHLEVKKTTSGILSDFYCPGIRADLLWFC